MSGITISGARIEPLSKENYDTWKMQVEALLIKCDLWEYVAGSTNCPDPPANGADASVIARVEAQRHSWVTKDRKARSELILSIHPSQLSHVRNLETSHEVWVKLESIYASKGPARKATLLKQLILQRMTDGSDVRDHMFKFFDCVDKLNAMEIEINNDLLSIMLLYSLPTSYENFRVAIESRDELPKVDALKVKILEEYDVRNQVSSSNVISNMAVKFNPKIRRNKPKGKNKPSVDKSSDIHCFVCGTPGFKSPDCPVCHPDRFNKSKHAASRSKIPGAANAVDDSYLACHVAPEESYQAVNLSIDSHRWILDSGCTAHLCGNKGMFNVLDSSTKGKLNLASNGSTSVEGKGVVKLPISHIQGRKVIELQNTLFVPDLRTNLMSVAKVADKVRAVVFTKDHAVAVDSEGNIKLKADRQGDLYIIQEESKFAGVTTTHNIQCTSSALLMWHKRLGHLNVNDLVNLLSDLGFPAPPKAEIEAVRRCETCLKGKMTNLPFCSSGPPARQLLQIVHSDVVGPMRVPGTNGAKWYSVARTPQQNGLAERMNRTLLDMARCLLIESGLPPKFWSDAVATAAHIRNRSPTSALNGLTPYEKWTGSSPTLSHMRTFGAEAFVLDKDPTKDKFAPKAIKGIFVGYPRETKGYRIWIPGTTKVVVARDVRFVREPELTHSFDDANFETLILPHDDEEQYPRERNSSVKSNDGLSKVSNSASSTRGSSSASPTSSSSSNVLATPRRHDAQQIPEDIRRAPGRPSLVRTGRPGRPRKVYRTVSSAPDGRARGLPDIVDVDDDVFENVEEEFVDAESSFLDNFSGAAEVDINEALNCEDRAEWTRAIIDEIESLVSNNTFQIIKRGDSQKTVGCRTVLTNKYNSDGSIARRKARIVAKGYSQKYGVDYHQTFAPVARMDSIRLLFALSAQLSLKVWQIDVVTAFLNGHLEEKIVMDLPDMLEFLLKCIIAKTSTPREVRQRAEVFLNDLQSGGNACKLNKALYGLKQAGRQWNKCLDETLKNIGLQPTKGEPCLYQIREDNKIALFLIYVDDLLIASNDDDLVGQIKRQLMEKYDLKDLGLAKNCLGLEICQGDEEIKLSQKGYVIGLLKKYGMENCNPVSTPSELKRKEGRPEKTHEANDAYPYREIIGALMYLATCTRPDIANTVSRLAQHNNNPTKMDWIAAKRVLRYLAGTSELGLSYRTPGGSLIGYSDSDWGNCSVDRKSYSGYMFLLADGAISWKSQKQHTVALSSTEAEYISLSEASKEAVYLHNLVIELKIEGLKDITLYVDNRGAELLASNHMYHPRTKHIDIRFHFIREVINRGYLKLEHVPTTEMTADYLTKPLSKDSHWKCVKMSGLN